MTRRGLRQLAVVERGDTRKVVGIVTLKDIARLLRQPTLVSSASPESSWARAASVAAADGPSGFKRTSENADGHKSAVPVSDLVHAADYPTATLEDGDASDLDLQGKDDEEAPISVLAEEPSATSPPDAVSWRQVAQVRSGVDPLADTTVAQAMLRTPRLVPESEPLAGVYARLDERGQSLMVVNGTGELVGLVTRSDLRGRSPVEDGRPLLAGDVAVRRLVTVRPDESLRVAVKRMSRLGLRQLPVVPKDSLKPVGLLRRSDILAAYAVALTPEQGEPTASPGEEEE
jgi:CBS domain-containing protein